MPAETYEDDDGDVCSVCGVDPSKPRTRTLLTNLSTTRRCGHRFCTTCVERGFERAREFACPVVLKCGAVVRRAALDPRSLEEIECDRDVRGRRLCLDVEDHCHPRRASRNRVTRTAQAAARKRVLAVFNAPATSFSDQRTHDDYLEQAEDLIYALTRGGAAAADADRKLQSEAAKDADAVARRAAARAEKDRATAAAVRDDKAEIEEAAEKLREKRRREKDKKRREDDHAEAYALGDRPDAPRKAVPRVMEARALPAPIGAPTNPRRVQGAQLDARRRAGGWASLVFDSRDSQALDRGLVRKPRAPYAPPAVYFGQRWKRNLRPKMRHEG